MCVQAGKQVDVLRCSKSAAYCNKATLTHNDDDFTVIPSYHTICGPQFGNHSINSRVQTNKTLKSVPDGKSNASTLWLCLP